MGEVLEMHARPGMDRPRATRISDSDVDHEWVLQQRMRNAVELLLRVSDEVNAQNVCGIKINRAAIEDFIDDELPVKMDEHGRVSLKKWDAKIDEAKRGK